ncbi:MAG TPA: protease pro-enzyme activation domain-containing protein, partial [Verrucomicrobiae bacterium]
MHKHSNEIHSSGRFCPLILLALFWIAFPSPGSAQTNAFRTLSGTMPAAVPRLVASGSVAPIENLRLAIGLPLRNQDALTNLLEQLYDPSDPHFHQWISSDDFTRQFAPTENDYAKVVRFAQAHGLTITHQHANRLLLDVTAASGTIEQAFKVKMRVYPHPTEKRNFYAPDREPSIPSDVPILHVSGMDNFSVPHPLYVTAHDQQGITPYLNGSGPSGTYTGNDFRKAYVPGVTNTGSGQYIAVIDVGGAYYTNDVYMYMTNAGLPLTIVYTNILLDGSTGVPNGNNVDDGEEALDIDMAMSMAPGATILNYEGGA